MKNILQTLKDKKASLQEACQIADKYTTNFMLGRIHELDQLIGIDTMLA